MRQDYYIVDPDHDLCMKGSFYSYERIGPYHQFRNCGKIYYVPQYFCVKGYEAAKTRYQEIINSRLDPTP